MNKITRDSERNFTEENLTSFSSVNTSRQNYVRVKNTASSLLKKKKKKSS